MKSLFITFFFSIITSLAFAGTWTDDFSGAALNSQWRGDRDYFSISNSALKGVSAHPIQPVPLRWVEVGKDWDDYIVQCRVNVEMPNLLVCTKGALILRHNGKEGYVFAIHTATKTVEVYSLSDERILLVKEEPLELKTWYRVRAELQGDSLSFYLDDKLIGNLTDKRSASGSIGLAVQDALSVLFDDFTVTGPKVEPGASAIAPVGKTAAVWGQIKTSGFKRRARA